MAQCPGRKRRGRRGPGRRGPGRPAGAQCGGHSLSRDHPGRSGSADQRQGRRASRPLPPESLGAAAAAGTLGSSLSPWRADPTRRQPRTPAWGPFGCPPLTHPEVKSCCTLSSRSRRVSSIASPPSGLEPPRPRTRSGASAPRARLSLHATAAAPSASPPPLRARPAQPQCRAPGRFAQRSGAGLRGRGCPLCRLGGKPVSRFQPEPDLLQG